MSGVLYRLGGLCARRPWLVLLAWAVVVAAVASAWVVMGARTSNDIRLPGTETQLATDFLAREFPPQQNGQSPVVFHVPGGSLTDPAVRRAVQTSLRQMRALPHVTSVTGPYSRARDLLMSDDERTAVAQVLLDVDGGRVTSELARELMAAAAPARAAGVQVEAGGVLGIRLSEESSRRSEVIGILAGIVILAVTFGALVAAGMPILTAVVGLVTGLGLVGLLGHVAEIPVVAPTLATMLGLGVGIDYALFIVFRYRDELHGGAEVREAVARALATSGTAVVFAGITVIIALLSLLVARVPILGAMGYSAALTVAVAVVTAITFLPAALAVAGRRIDALRLPWVKRPAGLPDDDNIWARWAGVVTRHPWIALIASLAVLLPLAAPTLTLILGQEDVGAWPASTTQRRAFDLVSDGLGPGANGRLLVAAEFDPAAEPSAAYTKKRRRAERLGRRLEEDGRRLEKQAKALERRRDTLVADKAALESQGAALQAESAALEARAAPLVAEKERLLAAKADLLADKRRLEARGEALEAEGVRIAAEIAEVQQKMAQTTDPVELARLQAELVALAQQAEAVQAEAAALRKQAAPLERRADRLEEQGRALEAESAGLTAAGAALESRAGQLAAEGAALAKRGTRLERDAAALKREKRRLQQQAKQARGLEKELTRLLTAAAGQPRATDPRVVRLQDALEAAPGVESVAPPSLNDSGSAAVFAITATTRPADPATSDLVAGLRGDVIPGATAGAGVTAYVGGVTAAYDDLASLISDRLPLVIGVVLALSFVVLLVAFRSLLVPLKAILCNLLAVGAAFGILTAFFQWGWGLGLVGLENAYGTVPIASYVPLIMFAVLFGMSTDYEVFLISQIFRAHAAGEGSHEAVRSGVGGSARVITAAAVIMVTVFISFVLVKDPIIKEFGIGLAVAILLDATIVRLVIVPATMVLLGDWNWYLPRWLEWLPRVDLPEERADAPATPAAASVSAPAPAGE